MTQRNDDFLQFGTQLLSLLDQASAITTYKYAVLLALIDLCQERIGQQGASGSITTRQLAVRVIEIYWPQTRVHAVSGIVLRQINNKKRRSIPDLIVELKEKFTGSTTTPRRAQIADPDGFHNLVDDVELILIRNPIPRLQKVGNTIWPILYTIQWNEKISESPVRTYQRALRNQGEDSSDFDNTIRLLPGVEENLASLAILLRPLIQREWTRLVISYNDRAIEDVESFLFSPHREDLQPVRIPLLDLQEGLCFYCRESIKSNAHVDHFLPWIRCADDHLSNYVVAHNGCNESKHDHLAAVDHLAAWNTRNETHSQSMSQIADDLAWPYEANRTNRLARSLYFGISPQTPLWLRRGEFVPADPIRIADALPAMDAQST